MFMRRILCQISCKKKLSVGFRVLLFLHKYTLCKVAVVNPTDNKRHAMHAEAMTFHKGSLIIFRTFVKKLGYIKVTDNFCAE